MKHSQPTTEYTNKKKSKIEEGTKNEDVRHRRPTPKKALEIKAKNRFEKTEGINNHHNRDSQT